MLKLKNITGARVDVYRPAELGGRPLDPDDVIEVEGRIVSSRPAPKKGEPTPPPIPDDAYLVEHNGTERAWPKALWELVDDKLPAKTPDAKADKEN